MLRITGPKRGLYWRATTLDQFDSDRWLENPTPLSTGPASGRLPNDPLLPTRSLNRAPGSARTSRWSRSATPTSSPPRSRSRSTHRASAASSTSRAASCGLYNGLKRGQSYTVYSYAPRPGPAELAPARGRVPAGARPLPRHRPHPRRPVRRPRPRSARRRPLRRRPLPRALAVRGDVAAGAPAASRRADAVRRRRRDRDVAALDRRLRLRREPPATGGLPPLAHFVAEGKRGYCQHFAGAMALMLRMLGIPARVAAGFTSGKYEDGGWTVTDHNAHAWVEVWFPGFGWLPFDPTPGRGSLAASYSASSTGFNAGDAADGFLGGAHAPGQRRRRRPAAPARAEGAARGAARRPADAPATRRIGAALWLLVLCSLSRPSSRSASPSSSGGAAAISRAIRDVWPVRPGASSSTSSPTRGSRSARARRRRSCTSCVQAELGADGRPFARALAEARFGPPEGSAAAATRARRELRKLMRLLRPAARPAGPPARPARAPLAADVIPAVVIAAGLGTRLRPLTERYAKPVLPVDGAPVIAHLLRELAAAGAPHVDRRDRAIWPSRSSSFVGDGSGFGRRGHLRTAERARRVGARRRRRGRTSAPYLVLGADTVFAPGEIGRFARRIRRRPARPGRSPSSRSRAPSRCRKGSSGGCSARACSRCRSGRSARPSRPGSKRCRDASVRALDRVSTGDRRGRGDSGDRGRPDARPDDAVRPPRAQLPLP